MRERATLLFFAVVATVSLLFALWRQQSLLKDQAEIASQREQLAREKDPRACERDTLAAELQAAWKQNVRLSEQLVSLAEKIERLTGERETNASRSCVELEKARQQIDELAKSLAAKETADQELKGKLEGLKASDARLDATATKLATSLGDLETRLKAEISKLSGTLKAEVGKEIKADEEKLLAAEREERRAELRRLEAALLGLEKRLDGPMGKKEAAAAAVTARPAAKPPPAVPVATTVDAVEANGGVVVLGAGKGKGLEPGHVLLISRAEKQVGRVRVLKVYDDLAGAEIVDLAPGESIQPGDTARTPVEAPSPIGPPPPRSSD